MRFQQVIKTLHSPTHRKVRLGRKHKLSSNLYYATQSRCCLEHIKNNDLNLILHLYDKLHNLTQCGYVLMIIDRIRGPIFRLKGHAFLIRRHTIHSSTG